MPEYLKLPYHIYKVVRKDNPNYIKFRELITSGKLPESKAIKEKLIMAYEAKRQVRRSELQDEKIDVEDMLGEIDDLHMEPMGLEKEVVLSKDINPEFGNYPNVVPAICPNLTMNTVEHGINHRGPIQDRLQQYYIVTDSGAEMVTLGTG